METKQAEQYAQSLNRFSRYNNRLMVKVVNEVETLLISAWPTKGGI